MANTRFWALGVLTLAVAAGCGVSDPSLGDQATDRQRRASTAFSLDTWSPRPMPLRMCTQRGTPTLSTNTYTTFRGWMFAALNATWGTIPGVTFTDVGECAGAAFDMSVTFTNDAFGGSCGRGVGNCAVNGPDMDVSANAQSTIQGVAVHEIGHGMGLLHEHQMPGAPPLCPYEKGILDSCRSCIAASDMGTPCAVSHYKGCFGKTIVIAHILDGNERATAQRYIDDRATVSDAKVLTTYDPLSIMDYCNYTNGRDRTDFTATALDRLGMEMLYPSTRTYGIGCGGGCLYSGDGVILRSNGAITSEWAARGAAGITMTWGAFVGASIPASLLPSDRSSLTYTFPEPRGTTRTGSGYVNKTDSLHGAIVSSLLVL